MDPPPWCLGLLLALFVVNDTLAIEKVSNIDDVGEFLFECEHWINRCKTSGSRKFFMLYDEQGNYLEEDKDSFSLKSIESKAYKPYGKELKSLENPSFLFELEKIDPKTDLFYIWTSSGRQLAVTIDEETPSLVLTKDDRTKAEARWRLLKDDIFLLIESSFTITTIQGRVSKFYLNVDKSSKLVRLDAQPEKMTGRKTSFYTGQNFTLDQSNTKETPPEGVKVYGDVKVHFKDRNGVEQEAYICDYDWSKEDAASLCRSLKEEDGLPTYNGKYSSELNPEYAISGVDCAGGDFHDCDFRTVCGMSDPGCIVQQSMKQFGGKGFACNRGTSSDSAGVLCGSKETIDRHLFRSIKCNRDTIQSDRQSVSEMFSLQNRVRESRGTMFLEKHWSEFILPLPMAVSLMSALMLVSSQSDTDIMLERPLSGKWIYLKYDMLQPNILQLAGRVNSDIELSYLSMGNIKYNSKKLHDNLKLAVQYAFSENNFERNTLMPRHLKYVQKYANKSTAKANEVKNAFSFTKLMIKELAQNLKNTESIRGVEKEEIEKALQSMNAQHKGTLDDLEKERKNKEKYNEEVKSTRKAYFQAAKDAYKKQCVNGNAECQKCTLAKERKTNECQKGASHLICKEMKQGPCKVVDEDFWSDDDCEEYEMECSQWESRCSAYVYVPADNYCEDESYSGKKCTKCDFVTEVEETMRSIGQTQRQLQKDAMVDGVNYANLCMMTKSTVDSINRFKKDIIDYTKRSKETVISKTTKETTISGTTEETSLHGTTEKTTITDVVCTKAEKGPCKVIDEDFWSDDDCEEYETKCTKWESKTEESDLSGKTNVSNDNTEDSGKEDNDKEIKQIVNLYYHQITMEISLLQEIKDPMARKLTNWMLKLKDLFVDMMDQKVKLISQIAEEDKLKLYTLSTLGNMLLNEAEKIMNKNTITADKTTNTGITSITVGDKASDYTDKLIEHARSRKKVDGLVVRYRKELEQILQQSTSKMDLTETIIHLKDCWEKLTMLEEQWNDITLFFKKLSSFFDVLKNELDEMEDFLADIGKEELLTETFRGTLQTLVVTSLVNNIFVMRLAHFYTQIVEEHVLKKMRRITSNLGKIDDPNALYRYKQFILNDMIATNEKIRLKVSQEEARTDDRITKEVATMKNDLACRFEDKQAALNSKDKDDNAKGIPSDKEKDDEDKQAALNSKDKKDVAKPIASDKEKDDADELRTAENNARNVRSRNEYSWLESSG